MPIPPPLLISPVDPLPAELSRAEVDRYVKAVTNIDDGEVAFIPFPIALYHRIDGIWLPVSDLGSFHSAPTGDEVKREPAESTYDPTKLVSCNDEDD